MKTVVIGLITAYQKTLSPDHGPLRRFYRFGVCRFEPTCSDYTKQAVRKYGTLKGLAKGAKRVWRCRPSNPGGYDPVT